MYKEIKNEHLGDCISSIAYHAGEDKFAVGVLDERLLVKEGNFETAKVFRGPLGIVDCSFSSNGEHLAYTSLDYVIRVVRTNELIESTNIECKAMEAWKVRFWSKKIVTGGDQGKVTVYDPTTGEMEKDFKFADSFISTIAVNGKNDLFVGNSKGGVAILDKSAFYQLKTDHKKYIRASAFAHDSTQVVVCSDDLRISVIDTHQDNTVCSYTGHLNLINAVDFHPTEPIFCTASNDKTVRLWDLRQSEAIDTISLNSHTPVWSCKFAKKGKELLIGTETGMLNLLSA